MIFQPENTSIRASARVNKMLMMKTFRKIRRILPVVTCLASSAAFLFCFAALRALTTKGIQHGHMKMHLQNILNQLEATASEKEEITTYFDNKTVSHSAVIDKFNELRK